MVELMQAIQKPAYDSRPGQACGLRSLNWSSVQIPANDRSPRIIRSALLVLAAALLAAGCGLPLFSSVPAAELLATIVVMIALAAALAGVAIGRTSKRPGERAGTYSARPKGLRSRAAIKG